MMNDLELSGKAAEQALKNAFGQMVLANNPANEPERKARAPRVSMSQQRLRLQVADIPGFRLYWFKDENVPAAQDAYYEFVKRGELAVNPLGIGSSVNADGNTDLGTNVSIVAGQNAAGNPVRLHLMKLPLEYYREDQKLIEQRNASILEAIFGDEAKTFDRSGNLREMDGLEFRKTALFNRPKRKVARPGEGTRELRERLRRLERISGIEK
jgi:hypothetical protein